MKEKITNLDYLRTFSGGDAKFIREMIDTFLAQTPKDLAAINQALSKKDWAGIGSTAHSLKTSTRFMGMAKTSEMLKTVELSGKEKKKLNSIPQLIKQIETSCQKAYKELKAEKV